MIEHLQWAIPTGALVGLMGLVFTHQKATDAKIGGVYRRLDEVKETTKKDFVSQPVCDVKYQQVVKTLDEIRGDVKSLLHKNGIK